MPFLEGKWLSNKGRGVYGRGMALAINGVFFPNGRYEKLMNSERYLTCRNSEDESDR